MKHLTICSVILLAACSNSSAQQPSSEAARVGDRVITVQQVDDAWRAADAAKFAEARQTLYDGRKATIDRLVAGVLLEQAAAAKQTTVEKLLAEEVTKRRTPVTPAEVETFFRQNQSQMQGQPLDRMRDVITRFLEDRREDEARDAYVAELKKAGPAVRVSLDPPRMSVNVAANDPVRGAKAATVTLVEFSDYECPYCARVTPTLKRLRDTYGDRIRIVWKDFPLTNIHPQAAKAGEAAHCAAEQGKYWEFHDRLFENQSALQPDALKKHAAALGLDEKVFVACLDSSRHAARIQQGIKEGQALGVSSTPTIFVNGRMVTGAHPYETFAAVIDDELARQK